MKNQLSAYELSCGGVQREIINNHWVELYREHNCYHIRMGMVGEKWSKWESFDGFYKSPLAQARDLYKEFRNNLKNLRIEKKCKSCSANTVNGIFCHELGCLNSGKIWNPYDELWEEPEIEEEDLD